MQAGANPQCQQCQGEGEKYFYWVNREGKRLASDFAYCLECFPSSVCEFAKDQEHGWARIEAAEAFDLERQGYRWMD